MLTEGRYGGGGLTEGRYGGGGGLTEGRYGGGVTVFQGQFAASFIKVVTIFFNSRRTCKEIHETEDSLRDQMRVEHPLSVAGTRG